MKKPSKKNLVRSKPIEMYVVGDGEAIYGRETIDPGIEPFSSLALAVENKKLMEEGGAVGLKIFKLVEVK